MLYLVYAVLGVCCTHCMLYSVYAVLGVCCSRHQLSRSWNAETERDDLTCCSEMMVGLWTRKRDMEDDDENDVLDTSGYEISGATLARMGREDLVSG